MMNNISNKRILIFNICLLSMLILQVNFLAYGSEMQEPNRQYHKCLECGEQFSNDLDRIRHWKERHIGHAGFSCFICKIPFRTRGELYAHDREVHKKRQRPKNTSFTCPSCHCTFTRESSLKRHKRETLRCKDFFKNNRETLAAIAVSDDNKDEVEHDK